MYFISRQQPHKNKKNKNKLNALIGCIKKNSVNIDTGPSKPLHMNGHMDKTVASHCLLLNNEARPFGSLIIHPMI